MFVCVGMHDFIVSDHAMIFVLFLKEGSIVSSPKVNQLLFISCQL